MKWVKWLGAVAMCVLLLAYPETALNAARQSMYTWAQSVAPALFPFMALSPLLIGGGGIYRKMFGWIMGPAFRLPGEFAPALVIAATAGSPAGAAAAAEVAARTGMGRDRLTRTAACICGTGPAFLISGVGAAMLGDANAGRILFRAQLATQFLLLTAMRSGREGAPVPEHAAETSGGVRNAAVSLLAVCGYMMIFSTVSALIARMLNRESVAMAVLCLADLPAGAHAVARSALPVREKMILLGGMTGFGGLCINVQNIAVLRPMGVKPGRLLAIRAVSGALCAAITALMTGKQTGAIFNEAHPLAFSALFAAIIAIPALISLGNTSFLNKEKSDKIRRRTPGKPQKPQDVVC